MIIRRANLTRAVFIFLIVLLISVYVPTNYFLVSPGTVEELGEMVKVAGGRSQGSISLVTVFTGRANILQLVYGLVSPSVEIKPKSQIVPPGFSEEEYREYLQTLMIDSQNTARAVALRWLGYEVDIRPQGVRVMDVLEDSPASGRLKVGDIIVAVDGKQVVTSDDLVSRIRAKNVGERVDLCVKRGEKVIDVEVTPTLIDGTTAIGIRYQPLPWAAEFPVDIDIDTGEIGGPSAGAMITLEIINQLTPEDLTGGRRIAGTGTISLDGSIGRIGGITQKILAAREAGIEIFFYPAENDKDITVRPYAMKLIPVSTLDDIINYLKN